MCLFHRSKLKTINTPLNGVVVKTTMQTNVLGVIFNLKLLCTEQVSQLTKKADKGVNAIKIIKNYFEP